MHKGTILLLDSRPERARTTQFLLQLANYQVAVVGNDEEAYNWLVSREDSPEQASLLLINDFLPESPILGLLPQLRGRGVQFPVLLVDRDNKAGNELDGSNSVACCLRDEMLGRIRTLLATTQTLQHPREGPQVNGASRTGTE